MRLADFSIKNRVGEGGSHVLWILFLAHQRFFFKTKLPEVPE